ncbi:MAG: RidA family protein [Actinomycetia bacterium]|nr:RidA family protein [Actinomycetes bacterium]MCP4961343.1 RidA family protein [Actinomycetes bacterium]
MTHKPVIPEGHEKTYARFHFAPAAISGDFVFVSGIIGHGSDGRVPDDPVDEARAVFASMASTLAAAGTDLGAVVDMTSFHTDMTQIGSFIEAKDEVMGEPYSAWTAIGCTSLVDPRARIEVKVTARLGSG